MCMSASKEIRERGREMVSCREQEKAANYRKLQLLRHITYPRHLISFQRKRPSVIFDEFKYAKQLKQNMERVQDDDGDDDVAQEQNSAAQNPFVVNVEQEEEKERFLVTVLSEAKCSGLLVFILEALEDVGLDVLHARVSCSDNFHLEAAVATANDSEEREDDDDEKVDAEGVKQEVLEAIQKWRGIRSDQTQE